MQEKYIDVLPLSIQGIVMRSLKPDDEEIRISAGRPIMLIGSERRKLNHIITVEECENILELICGHSVFAHEEELKGCYITLEDGSRVGIAGKLTPAGMTMPHSFNIRIARQVKGAADEFIKYILTDRLHSALLLSEPGAGKTTVLRDAAKQLSERGYKVGVADERGEISASVNGIPMLDVGYADVMSGCMKAWGMTMLLRGMSPEVLITDEIASEDDAVAVSEASGCGVRIIASAHGRGADVLRRRGIGKVIGEGAFEKVLLLTKEIWGRKIRDISGEVI